MPPYAQSPPMRIDDIDQLGAVSDPHRMAILRLLMAGPATLTQLADVLGTYTAWVRHHLKRLEDVGLVHLVRCVKTRNYMEKYYEATSAAYAVHMMVVPDRGEAAPLVVLHCDMALEALTDLAGGEIHASEYSMVFTGSLDGLIALRQGLADVAGCHLLDSDTGQYNIPFVRHLFPGRAMTVVTLADREQGLLVRPGNPLGITNVSALAQTGARIVNRELGSGTRTWLDSELTKLGIPSQALKGYDEVVDTHAAVAEAVLAGTADAGIAPRAVAQGAGLAFVPLLMERYDIVMDAGRMDEGKVARLLDTLTSRAFRRRLRSLGGYDASRIGDVNITA